MIELTETEFLVIILSLLGGTFLSCLAGLVLLYRSERREVNKLFKED
jgi:hypothetical protein